MKGKVSFSSQDEFASWLSAMNSAYSLENTDEYVAMCPLTYPCVVSYEIKEAIISVTYIYGTDFIK